MGNILPAAARVRWSSELKVEWRLTELHNGVVRGITSYDTGYLSYKVRCDLLPVLIFRINPTRRCIVGGYLTINNQQSMYPSIRGRGQALENLE